MSASEKIRYWTDWIVKNLPALLTIGSLLGFSGYKINEGMNQDAIEAAMSSKITELAEKTYNRELKVPRGTKCNCKTLMNKHKREFH